MNQCDNPLGADNQQERSILSPDAIAGLIVGEGSYFIGIRRQRWFAKRAQEHREVITMYPAFMLRMNDAETMDLLHRSCAAHGHPVRRTSYQYKGCIGVELVNIKQMRDHLDWMLPHLFGNKRKAALIVSEFTDRRLKYPNRRFEERDLELLVTLRSINGPTRGRLSIEILRDYMQRPNQRAVGQEIVRSA